VAGLPDTDPLFWVSVSLRPWAEVAQLHVTFGFKKVKQNWASAPAGLNLVAQHIRLQWRKECGRRASRL